MTRTWMVAGEIGLQHGGIGRVEFDGRQPVLLAQKPSGDQRRAGIERFSPSLSARTISR
jgi:hypothetical protein